MSTPQPLPRIPSTVPGQFLECSSTHCPVGVGGGGPVSSRSASAMWRSGVYVRFHCKDGQMVRAHWCPYECQDQGFFSSIVLRQGDKC